MAESLITVDDAFTAWARNLASIDVGSRLEPVMKKSALQVKNKMRADAMGHPHAKALPYRVSYDVKKTGNALEAQIGPTEGGAGSLAMYWLGNSRLRPVLPDPMRYLQEEADLAGRYAVQALEKAFGGS